MPQLFQVLRCYKCSVFQVHQTKKSMKWECKLCGEKQSIKRHYGLGTGKECRLHVQNLNGLRGEIDELCETMKPHIDSDEEAESQYASKETNSFLFNMSPQVKKQSKWSEFVEKTENVPEPDNESMYLGNTEVVLEVRAKRRKFTKPRVIHKETASKAQEVKSNYIDEVNNFQDCRLLKTNAFTEPIMAMTSNSSRLSIASESQNDFTSRSGKNDILTSNEEVLSLQDQKEKYKDVNKLVVETLSCQVKKEEKFVLPKVSKNSKWVQFTDENKHEPSSRIEETHAQNIHSNLFSLCDENDLDDVLNF